MAMNYPSDAYMEGYIASQEGKARECLNPWNVQWQREWLRGYDEASETIYGETWEGL